MFTMLSKLTLFISLLATTTVAYPVDRNTTDPFADLIQPYTPSGGNGTDNTTVPYYHPLSDFDYQSLLLALNQEYIELDLFNYGLAKFSAEEFEAQGFTTADRDIIHQMAIQEVGHAQLISNMLGESAPKRCNYTYPFETVPEFIAYSQQLTRWGESGVYGFLGHLDSRAAASLLLQSITVEARQQFIFRQFQGLSPMPYDFIAGVPQAWAWTLLAPYVTSCPAENPYIEFQNFPALHVLNPPKSLSNDIGSRPAISTNNNTLTEPGRKIQFSWDEPGKATGWVAVHNAPNINYTNAGEYNGSTTGNPDDVEGDKLYKTATLSNGVPKFAAWVSQLNTTYTNLTDVNTDNRTAWTIQPDTTVFPNLNNTIVNGTVFVALVDEAVPITSFNITKINEHVVAGPVLYQAD